MMKFSVQEDKGTKESGNKPGWIIQGRASGGRAAQVCAAEFRAEGWGPATPCNREGLRDAGRACRPGPL